MLRPKSIGYIELRSANPYEPPIIEPRYLTHEKDIQSMVDAMKIRLNIIDFRLLNKINLLICLFLFILISIAVGSTPAYRQLGAELFDTQMPGCEQVE